MIVVVNGVGALVRERRLFLGLNQTELGRRAGGLTQDYISKLENGLIETPQRGTMDALAKALEVPVSALYRAAGILEGVTNEPLPAPPVDDEDEYIPDDEIVAYVKARPGRFFQRDIAALEHDLSPADFVEQCRDIFTAWKSNSRLAVRAARRGR